MPPSPLPATSLAVVGAVLISLATLFRLFQKHIDGRPLLEYEPRRPVPWNGAAPLLLLLPLAFALSSTLFSEPKLEGEAEAISLATSLLPGAAAAPPAAWYVSFAGTTTVVDRLDHSADAAAVTRGIWGQAMVTLTLSAACYALLVLAYGATPRDLGLPESGRQFANDVKIGVAACAASLVPIYAILIVLKEIVRPTEGHPLIEELVVNHSFGMMAAAAFTAVVAAPLYEETTFRLVLQGWLEKLAAGRRTPLAPPTAGIVGDVELIGEGIEPTPVAPTETISSPASWAPIVVSGVLFGLAHWGHGVAPLPLILLGGVLGYVYRQTHRIVPCIVCHLLFNGFTFLLLALEFAGGG